MLLSRPALVLPVAIALPLFSACGSSPSTLPNVSPTTTLAAAPTPAPSPTPAGPTLGRSCAGPPPVGRIGNCARRTNPQLKSELGAALDHVRGIRDIYYPDGVTIRDLGRFRKEVVNALDSAGVCAIFDYGNRVGDELYVRSSDNRVSEAYDVLTGNGQAWIGYQNTCEPAIEGPPLDPAYPNRDPQCRLPPSADSFCLGHEFESEYGADVRQVIQGLVADRPELFDKDDALLAEMSYRLKDPPAYIAAVLEKLRQRGYCAIEDEELIVKKDDVMSENFDIVRTPGDRPGQYSLFAYKGRCHAATF
jgi:hypothetical protein